MKSVGQKRQRAPQIGSKKWQGGPPSEGFRHLGHFATGRQKTMKVSDTTVRAPSNR